MLTKNKKNKKQPWFCGGCEFQHENLKHVCKKCLEDTYQELKKILDKDILDDLLDEF